MNSDTGVPGGIPLVAIRYIFTLKSKERHKLSVPITNFGSEFTLILTTQP